MKNIIQTAARDEKGFTLVELAVVMIIVGLLIGGILKGQEMIANAQVTSTVAAAKAYDAATSTFRDQYNSFPGDMLNAETRLVNCDGTTCANGDGDGHISINVGGANSSADEGGFYFNQLRAAELVSGFTGSADDTFGTTFPTAPVGGGFMVGSTIAGATGFTGGQLRVGHYIVLAGAVADVATGTGVLTPSQAARIDAKMDDGAANSGSVVAQTDAGDCVAAADDAEYAEAETANVCAIAIRVQG